MSIEHHKFNMDRQTNLLIEILVQEKTLLEDKVGELTQALQEVKSQLEDSKQDHKIIINGIKKALT